MTNQPSNQPTNQPTNQQINDMMQWIDDQHHTLVDTLIEWANQNSGSTNLDGINAYRTQLSQAFSTLLDENNSLEQIALPPLNQINNLGESTEQAVADALLIRKRPHLTHRVLLCGHMDTVYPKNHAFQQCQLIDDNTLNGPGVADMKGGILVMLTALKAFEQCEIAQNIGWDVLLTPDEEIGSQSSAPLFERFSDHAFGMIYEPSLPDGEYVGFRKGSGNFTIVVRGKAAHAGREFFKGRNAISQLAHIVSELHALNDPEQSTTLNIGIIQGGQALNVVPDLAIARFNIRVESDEASDAILNQIDAILARYSTADYQVTRHGKMTRPAKPMDPAQVDLFNRLKNINHHLNLPTKIIPTGGCCDGNNFKSIGLPNIDTLGVRGGNIHSDKEYVLLDSLCERSKVSAHLLLDYANSLIQTNKDNKTNNTN